MKSVKSFSCDGCHVEMRLSYRQKIAIFERNRQSLPSDGGVGQHTPDLTSKGSHRTG
ncbi:hypothetical protein [Mesorhizobium sp.]|uniref:hypothetical protein n=1 Tax=Mesorhizobium sp. TaxID=1871066 RepID=UPI0025B9AE90|nr:hypothetical protein [Mesorhizobium sp.]